VGILQQRRTTAYDHARRLRREPGRSPRITGQMVLIMKRSPVIARVAGLQFRLQFKVIQGRSEQTAYDR
jgi:hypothetical protein